MFRHPRNPRALRSNAKVGARCCDCHASHFHPVNSEFRDPGDDLFHKRNREIKVYLGFFEKSKYVSTNGSC